MEHLFWLVLWLGLYEFVCLPLVYYALVWLDKRLRRRIHDNIDAISEPYELR